MELNGQLRASLPSGQGGSDPDSGVCFQHVLTVGITAASPGDGGNQMMSFRTRPNSKGLNLAHECKSKAM